MGDRKRKCTLHEVHEGDTWAIKDPLPQINPCSYKVKIIAKDTVKSFYLVNFKIHSPVYPENGRVRMLTSYLSFTDQCLFIPDWSICYVRRIGVNIFSNNSQHT